MRIRLRVKIAVLFLPMICFFNPILSYADITDKSTATWNMQGSSLTGENKWRTSVVQLVDGRSGSVEVLAIQEAGTPPPSSTPDTVSIPIVNPDGITDTIQQLRWNLGTRSRENIRYVYFMHTLQRVSLAIVTSVRPDSIIVHENLRAATARTARPVIGVRYGNDVYYSFHALASGNSNEAAEMIVNIHDYYRSIPNGSNIRWMVMGDFNRESNSLCREISSQSVAAATNTTVIQQQSPTQRSGHNIDYAVIGQVGSSICAAAGASLFNAQLSGLLASDHTHVKFMKPF